MISTELYAYLDWDFKVSRYVDVWDDMGNQDIINKWFLGKFNGVMLDNAKEINYVYTAVFPSDHVIQKIIDDGKEDVLLFVHHPRIWDIRNAPNVFSDINPNFFEIMKDRRISIYSLHIPLDRNGEFSTTVSLAEKLGITKEGDFYNYHGVMVGVIGRTTLAQPQDLADKLASIVGHKVRLIQNGANQIKNSRVALVAGSNCNIDVVREVADMDIDTLICGVTKVNDKTKEGHNLATEKGINIIGGTHFSTEKFACIKILEYFEKHRIEGEFIDDEPVLEDLE